MSKIKVMDENLANKIAAGEVVESCSSVVKELVENSIDAESTEITVSLVEGGLKEIKVTDNGTGMDENDAALAFSRHATSKLLKEDDLYFIDTLGFRGEALPSIASVSIVNLKTCVKDVGTEINIEGGKLINKSKCEARKGTSIIIKDLFYNTPARLKYLKGPKEELALVVSFLEKLALSKPHIKFSLLNNEKFVFKTSGSNDLLKTIHEIYGFQVSSNMINIKNGNNDYDIDGYICKPVILKSNRNHLIVFVNGRIIKNNDINKAINDAYYTHKPENKFPIVVLNINTDPTLIDVNIHPTKQDIKLSKKYELINLINETIKKALYESELIVPIRYEDTFNYEENPQLKESNEQFNFNFNEQVFNNENQSNEIKPTSKIFPVALLLGTYIVCQNESGIYLIDQHAAEERINYEIYFKALGDKTINKISLLVPITIELPKSEYLIIEESKEILTNIGFDLEEFGINTIRFTSHPTWLKEGHEEESIKKILDLLVVNKDSFNVTKFNESVAITLACKLSIKANYEINISEMEKIIEDLFKCENPYNCPHGRPTIISFSTYELERMFKRVV